METNHDETKELFALGEEQPCKEADKLNIKTKAGREALLNDISNTIDKLRAFEAELKSK